MAKVSNRFLAVIVTASIIISLAYTVSIFNTIYKLQRFASLPVTGRAQTAYGNVSLEIQNQVSIVLNDFEVDFGTGFVNTSCQQVLTNYSANLTVRAGATSADRYIDDSDCWIEETPGTIPDDTPFEIENTGNLNASVSINGPDNATFFTSGGVSYNSYGAYLDWYRVAIRANTSENEPDACAGTMQTSWALLDQNVTLCSNLRWNDDATYGDEITVEVNVWVPMDIQSGLYNASSIEFYAVQS